MKVKIPVGEAWYAPHPRCPEHGKMSPRREPDGEMRYHCPGWDGEGCDYVVGEDELDWRPLSQENAAELTGLRLRE